jgi:hypothetical protein
MCPVVFSGANEQRRCRCIPRELEIPMTSLPCQVFAPLQTPFQLPPSSMNR